MKYFAHFLLLAALSMLLPLALRAQDGDQIAEGKSCESCVKFSYGVKFKSRHVWNGHLTSNAWTFQPDLTLSWKGLFFNIWTYAPVAPLMSRKKLLPSDEPSHKTLNTEIDFALGYEYGPFSVLYLDMFYIDEETRFNYLFRWDDKDAGDLHQHWAQVKFSGVEKFPVMLTVGAFTWGDYADDGKGGLKPWYSMYIGAGYSHTLRTGQRLTYEIGGTPYKGFFAPEGANICNVKFAIDQPVHITDKFGLNLGGELVVNPVRENVYFTFSLGLL